jgi:hypothetical protein
MSHMSMVHTDIHIGRPDYQFEYCPLIDIETFDSRQSRFLAFRAWTRRGSGAIAGGAGNRINLWGEKRVQEVASA